MPAVPYTYSNDGSHNKTLLVITICAAVVTAVILIWSAMLKNGVTPTVPVTNSGMSAKQKLLVESIYNPPANISTAEAATKTALVSKTNPPAKLTPAQLQAKQTLIQNL